MNDSEPSVISTYQYGDVPPSIFTYPVHATVVVAPTKPVVVVDHGTPSDFEVVRQFLNDVRVE